MPAPYPAAFSDGTPYPTWTAPTTSVPVSGPSALAGAISSLSAGQKLVLAAGTYSSLSITGKSGTAGAGIGIEAAAGATSSTRTGDVDTTRVRHQPGSRRGCTRSCRATCTPSTGWTR